MFSKVANRDICFPCTCDHLGVLNGCGHFDPDKFPKNPFGSEDMITEVSLGRGRYVLVSCWDIDAQKRTMGEFKHCHHDTIVVGVASLAGYNKKVTHWGCGIYFGPQNHSNLIGIFEGTDHEHEASATASTAAKALELAGAVAHPWPCKHEPKCALRNVVIKTTSRELATFLWRLVYHDGLKGKKVGSKGLGSDFISWGPPKRENLAVYGYQGLRDEEFQSEYKRLWAQIRSLAGKGVAVSGWLVGRGMNDEAFGLAKDAAQGSFDSAGGDEEGEGDSWVAEGLLEI